MSYTLSRRAQTDIEEIWDYSADLWSVAQADAYILGIKLALDTIGATPRRGRVYRGRSREYRRFSVGSHVIFYREAPEGVAVVRILHQSMDFDRHL